MVSLRGCNSEWMPTPRSNFEMGSPSSTGVPVLRVLGGSTSCMSVWTCKLGDYNVHKLMLDPEPSKDQAYQNHHKLLRCYQILPHQSHLSHWPPHFSFLMPMHYTVECIPKVPMESHFGHFKVNNEHKVTAPYGPKILAPLVRLGASTGVFSLFF